MINYYTPEQRHAVKRAWNRVIAIFEDDQLAGAHTTGLCILLEGTGLSFHIARAERERLRGMFENPDRAGADCGFGAFVWPVRFRPEDSDFPLVLHDPSRWARLMAAVVMRETA